MLPDLISIEDYSALPDSPELKFLALEELCRGRMLRAITSDSSTTFDSLIRGQYAAVVSTAAEELGISGFPTLPASVSLEDLDEVAAKVTVFKTRIALRGSSSRDAHSVRLAAGTRGKIEQQVDKLRQMLKTSDLPESKRRTLLEKLDDLSMELSQTRVSFAKIMAVLAFVGGAVVNGTVFLAEAPHAIATIAGLLGRDKAAEDAEQERLGPPMDRKQIPQSPTRRALPPARKTQLAETLDDEIPF